MLTFPNIITAMITPFHEDGSVNYEAFVDLAKKYADEGAGILVAATTGEGAVMTEDEKLKLFKMTADALKDKTLVMGNVGTNNTAQSIALAKKAEETGVDAILCIVPYYNKPNQEGCYAHFAAIAKSTKLPIFIYNVPGRTGGKIEPPTVCKLAHDFPNIIGLKDASGDLDYAGYVAANAPEGFHLYSGDDNLTLPIVAVGGEGVREGQRHGFGEQELLPDGKEPGFEHHREGEVFTFGAGPRMSPLAASGGLPFGPDDVAVAVFRVAGFVVGRGGFVDTVDHELFILSWVGFSGGRRDQTDTPKSRRASFSEVFLSVDSLRWPMIRAQVMLYSPAGNCLR